MTERDKVRMKTLAKPIRQSSKQSSHYELASKEYCVTTVKTKSTAKRKLLPKIQLKPGQSLKSPYVREKNMLKTARHNEIKERKQMDIFYGINASSRNYTK